MNRSLLIIFIIISNLSFGQTYISSDTTWNSDTLTITNDFVIEENATLTISPGKVLLFSDYTGIEIKGRILAIGNSADSIEFTVTDTIGYSDTATINGGWKGLFFNLNTSSDSSVLSHCKFSFGKAIATKNFNNNLDLTYIGGAIIVNDYDNILIQNSKFNNNYAYLKGGALYIDNADNIVVDNCLFERNKTYNMGGGIYVINSKCEITNNTFDLNMAERIDTIFGGGLGFSGTGSAIYSSFCNYNYPLIYNNRISRGIGVSGCIYDNNISAIIANNLIINNNDNGFFNGHGNSSSRFVNNTIVNNYLFHSDISGGAVFSKYYKLRNNIIWGNEAGVQNPDQIYDDGLDLDMENSCIQYGYPGEGNISTNPQFANPTEGAGMEYDGLSADWSLLETSPCINTGTPDTTGLNLPEFDIAGNPRVFGGRIDMGAYENQSVYVKINESPVYSKINVYPNPGNNEIYIDIPPEINGSWIDIVDGQGKILMHEQINISPEMLSPYKLKSGIYYYRIYNENKVIKSGKWVKNAG